MSVTPSPAFEQVTLTDSFPVVEPTYSLDTLLSTAAQVNPNLLAAEAALAACEASEAPAPYRDFSGYVTRGRDGPYWVEIKNCDDARLDLEAARREADDFEEQARRSSVPPGWMR